MSLCPYKQLLGLGNGTWALCGNLWNEVLNKDTIMYFHLTARISDGGGPATSLLGPQA